MVRDSSRARGGGAFDEQGHEAPDLASVESMVGGLNRSVDPVGIEELVPLDQMCAHRVDALFFSDVHDRNCGPVDGGREGSSVGFIRFECTLIPLPPLSDAHAIPIHTNHTGNRRTETWTIAPGPSGRACCGAACSIRLSAGPEAARVRSLTRCPRGIVGQMLS